MAEPALRPLLRNMIRLCIIQKVGHEMFSILCSNIDFISHVIFWLLLCMALNAFPIEFTTFTHISQLNLPLFLLGVSPYSCSIIVFVFAPVLRI